MKILKANKKDFLEMAKIIKLEFAKPPYKDKWTIENAIKVLSHYYKNGFVLKAIENKKIIGLIAIRFDYVAIGKVAFIEDLLVVQELQGKGIGKSLVKKAEEELKKEKIKYVYLTTNKNAPAVKFYKKLNYKASKYTLFMNKKIK